MPTLSVVMHRAEAGVGGKAIAPLCRAGPTSAFRRLENLRGGRWPLVLDPPAIEAGEIAVDIGDRNPVGFTLGAYRRVARRLLMARRGRRRAGVRRRINGRDNYVTCFHVFLLRAQSIV